MLSDIFSTIRQIDLKLVRVWFAFFITCFDCVWVLHTTHSFSLALYNIYILMFDEFAAFGRMERAMNELRFLLFTKWKKKWKKFTSIELLIHCHIIDAFVSLKIVSFNCKQTNLQPIRSEMYKLKFTMRFKKIPRNIIGTKSKLVERTLDAFRSDCCFFFFFFKLEPESVSVWLSS